eukprot:Phypoly_transcript_07426.p1 GENE.Phypoly_transcript_07426~~Phypoly_transcript_07426.p1  ORF type:complete len:297 (+),score=33.70 Phypoly_transcript_07426:243-1133(+)
MRGDNTIKVQDTKERPKNCVRAFSCQMSANDGTFCYTILKWPWMTNYYESVAVCRASNMRLPGYHDMEVGAFDATFFTFCTACAWSTITADPLAETRHYDIKYIARNKFCSGYDGNAILNCSIDSNEGPFCSTGEPICQWYLNEDYKGWSAACAKNLCEKGKTVDTEDGCKPLLFGVESEFYGKEDVSAIMWDGEAEITEDPKDSCGKVFEFAKSMQIVSTKSFKRPTNRYHLQFNVLSTASAVRNTETKFNIGYRYTDNPDQVYLLASSSSEEIQLHKSTIKYRGFYFLTICFLR